MEEDELKRFSESLDRVTALLIDGLTTEGGLLNKQWYLEEALHELAGRDFFDKAKSEFDWDNGIPL